MNSKHKPIKVKAHSFTVILLFLLCFVSTAFSQQEISGVVLEDVTHNPVADATVYLNGTTIGTSTDSNGLFRLKGVSFPCKMIVSRIGFDLKTVTLNEYNVEVLTVLLKEKAVQLSEIEVTGKNSRDKGVGIFRKYFLGRDSWSTKTFLKNESVLEFKSYTEVFYEKPDTTDYTVLKADNNDLTKSDTITEAKTLDIFSVKAKEPVIIDFPSLGYQLFVDLVNFYLIKSETNTICKYLAYYYYKPYEFKSKAVERRYQTNRIDAFYNSREHFFRMLFKNKLKENGYLVVDEGIIDNNSPDIQAQFVNLNDFVTLKNSKEAVISGLNGKTFSIYSFYNYNNKPIDMSKPGKYKFKTIDDFWMANYAYLNEKSTISFAGDSCTIRSDGTIFDEKIMIGGKMIKKKVDAMIPDIYIKE